MRKQPGMERETRKRRAGRILRRLLLGAAVLIIVIYGLLILFPDLK